MRPRFEWKDCVALLLNQCFASGGGYRSGSDRYTGVIRDR